jgi:hypothetical protein
MLNEKEEEERIELEKGTSILVHSRASQLPVEESDASLKEVVGVGRCFGKSMPATAEEVQLRRGLREREREREGLLC